MPSLHELQTRILDAVLGAASEDALPLLHAAHPGGAARLAVYGSTVRHNAAQALRSTFPAIWRLVGEEYFCRLTRELCRREPSRSGDLRHLAGPFPACLAQLHAADEYRYLADIAHLELLIQDVLLAPEHPPLDLAKVAAVAPAAYDSLHFVLHPALRLFQSPYPAQRIWECNVGDAEPEAIDLAAGADRLAVLRQRLQLQFHRLSRGEWNWLVALERGEPFAASVAAGGSSDADFDAAAALRRFVALEAIVDCR